MLPACEGNEKGYLVNRSESTLMLVGQKRDEDKTPVMSAILNHFDFVPTGDCSASKLKEKQKH